MHASKRRVRLRKARAADLPGIHALEAVCFDPERQSSVRSIRNSLQSTRQSVWTAEAEGRLVGALILFHHAGHVRIYSIAVAPEHRGRGTGQSLVRLAKVLARRRKCPALTLEAENSDSALIRWYQQQGFEMTETLADYYGPGRSACRMVCRVIPVFCREAV